MQLIEFEFTVFVATEAGTSVYLGTADNIQYKHQQDTRRITIRYLGDGGSVTSYYHDHEDRDCIYKVFITQHIITTKRRPTTAEAVQTDTVIAAYIKGTLVAQHGKEVSQVFGDYIGGA